MELRSFMIIAGEPSGDALGAALILALRNSAQIQEMPFAPRFFGAGGPQMKAAGVELELDMTVHAVFGLSDALKQYPKFLRIFRRLFELARERKPDFIILVDYAGFNRRFASAIKRYVRSGAGRFANWQPRIVYYVSPQVWASREDRAYQLARDVDLLLSIFPFEKEWYSQRVPQLRVEYVGHPLLDRFAELPAARNGTDDRCASSSSPPLVLLLPGSRTREVRQHLPVMLEAAQKLGASHSLRFQIVLPNERLKALAEPLTAKFAIEIKVGDPAQSLIHACIAIAKSGTVTLECAYFSVPTVVIYKLSAVMYWLARQMVRVKFIAMPNLIAGEAIFPELIQNRATADNIVAEATDLLSNRARRASVREKLREVIEALGQPGASGRAADAILRLERDT